MLEREHDQNIERESVVFKRSQNSEHTNTPFERVCGGSVDAVFLWVNGTSQRHLDLMKQYGRTKVGGLYKDYGTLRFGFRSIVAYAPWIKRIFLVTDGEVPDYIDEEKGKTTVPQLIIVPHSTIIEKEVLPTFNSNTIESYLHKIPTISKCILYLNDDMMLGRPVKPEFWLGNDGRLNVYHNGFVAPNKEGEKTSIWHRSVSTSNKLVSDKYGNGNTLQHPYPSHHCYFMLTDTLNFMENTWKDNYTAARQNKFRKANDIVISFLHAAVTVEENKGEYVKQRRNFYFNWWTGNHTQNSYTMNHIAKKENYCVCLNDDIADATNADREIEFLYKEYSKVLPDPCPFEK
ncbi:hypothetical protein EIN_247170 [Entamoeba invadens IP1]|uniref:Uncharacterized protein n=1 Tax=Entamoeba invadens IP1 TaxID=370355 RepID=A0A0A1UEA9_ENTIV|nr:hypothetical protein EIN_247170 [Entamoeba invadens IP1]ELP94823.1 hypothetical protein EIN_247170 [Entamoeba invadens IP1]|eukprot:XP_004261594.1 hypothetical protein EIN_247170 [Entamoeba invadens IP1]